MTLRDQLKLALQPLVYIYWPNGLLTIKRDGEVLFDSGFKHLGYERFGAPCAGDKVEYPPAEADFR